MDLIYFIVRYIPWWGAPVLTTGLYFSYIYALKQIYFLSAFFALNALVSIIALIYYIYVGSPDKAVETFRGYIGILFH